MIKFKSLNGFIHSFIHSFIKNLRPMKAKIVFFLALFYTSVSPVWAQYLVRNLKTDFHATGDGSTDDSQAFIDASIFFNTRHGHGKLIIPAGTYRVGRQVTNSQKPPYVREDYYLFGLFMMNINSCTDFTVQGEDSPVVKYLDGLKFGTFEADGSVCTSGCDANRSKLASIGSFFNIVDSDSITINNLEIDGNNPNMIVGNNFQTGYQIDHDGIFITGTSKVITMNNVRSHHFGRDGIQIALSTPNGTYSPSNNIVLNNCSFEYNGRQGMSWVGGKGVTATNCKFNYTGKGRINSIPSSGIDLEPEVGAVTLGSFINCEFNLNAGNGIVTSESVYPRPESSAPSSTYGGNMNFDECRFQGNNSFAIFIHGQPNYQFSGCNIAGTVTYSNVSSSEHESARFVNSIFTDEYNGVEADGGPVMLNFPLLGDLATHGVFAGPNYALFDHCDFTIKHKKLAWIRNSTSFEDGSCRPAQTQTFVNFRSGSIHYGNTNLNTSGYDYISNIHGATFSGNWVVEPISSISTQQPFYIEDNYITGFYNSGTTTLRAGNAVYTIGCPGLWVGANDDDAVDFVVEQGNHLSVTGQMFIAKKARVIIKSGASLYVGGGTTAGGRCAFGLHGKLIIEDGGTLNLSRPTLWDEGTNILAEPCEDELYIAPGAIVLGRTDFSGTNVNVTGGRADIITGGNCVPATAGKNSSVDLMTEGTSASRKIDVYPNPFQQAFTVSFPPSKEVTHVQLIDMYGRVAATYLYSAGDTQATIGQELKAGIYSVVIQQSREVTKTTRVQKLN